MRKILLMRRKGLVTFTPHLCTEVWGLKFNAGFNVGEFKASHCEVAFSAV